MKATFNAVGEVLDTAGDAYVAYTKAISARLAGVMRKVTPALEEITEALEGSTLPAAVKRLKGIEAEMQAAVAEYMPSIMEAAGPLSEAAQRLETKWKALTKTDAEAAKEEQDATIDTERESVAQLEKEARELPHGSPMRERARDLAGNLKDALEDRPLSLKEHSALAAMGSEVRTEQGRVKRMDEHAKLVDALDRSVGGVSLELYREAIDLISNLRHICASFYVDEAKRRPLNDEELEQLSAMTQRVADANTYVAAKIHAGDERVALHRKY